MKPISKLFDSRKKYNSIAAIIGGALLASVLIGLLLIRPAWGNLKTLGVEIPTEQAKRDKAKTDVQNLEGAKKFFTDQGEAVETINTVLPVEPSVPDILVILEDLARQNNVFVTSFSPQQIAATGGAAGTGAVAPAPGAATAPATGTTGNASSVEITANYRGQYSSLISFFYSLERSLRIVDVKTLNVSTTTGTAVEGNITFRAYYRPVGGGL